MQTFKKKEMNKYITEKMLLTRVSFTAVYDPKTKHFQDTNFPSKGKQTITFFVKMPSCH